MEDSCKPVSGRIDFSETTKLKTHFNNLIRKSLSRLWFSQLTYLRLPGKGALVSYQHVTSAILEV